MTVSIEVFNTAVLIVDTKTSKQILQVKQKLAKNANWREADQRGGVESRTTKLKSI